VNKNWYILNIDIKNAVNLDFKFEELAQNSTNLNKQHWDMWTYRYDSLTQIFTNDWLEYMRSINLEISSALLFYRLPKVHQFEAHIDMPMISGAGLSCPINWVIGKDTSSMVWYNLPEQYNYSNVELTPSNNKYVSFPISELIEIERHVIGNTPTLVRVDIPHMICLDEYPRWAISARTKVKFDSWENTLKYMTPYILAE
jgi:hypothetical protein